MFIVNMYSKFFFVNQNMMIQLSKYEKLHHEISKKLLQNIFYVQLQIYKIDYHVFIYRLFSIMIFSHSII